jgi:hypothetical protein
VDKAESGHDSLCLPALNVTDHVPGDAGRESSNLALSLLNPILAKVPLSKRIGRLDDLGRLGLGHCYQGDL